MAESGILHRYNVELIGAKLGAIKMAEDRGLFKEAMIRCNLEVPRSKVVHTLEEATDIGEEVNYAAVIRPAFTLGGSGAGISFNKSEYFDAVQYGLDASPITEVLIEESVIGWKEFELEVMRDLNDNVVIICSIEKCGSDGRAYRRQHHGRSPPQTLTDKEYQVMRGRFGYDYARDRR